MINYEALFKISYGIYIISSGTKSEPCGFIANAAFQVTAEPPQFAICCNKNNYSANIIKKTGAFGMSVLHQEASAETIGSFGYKSGKDINKFENISVKYSENGLPLITQDSIVILEFNLLQTIEVGTHYIFIGELMASEILNSEKPPLTYAFYREYKKGMAPVNAPTYIDESKLIVNNNTSQSLHAFKCKVCGYLFQETYEGEFEQLPHSWLCPICQVSKDEFEII